MSPMAAKDRQRLRWFWRFLGRAVMERKGRVAVASLSVMIAVGIMVSAAGVSLGIRTKLGGELKAYGANVMVSIPGGFLAINSALLSALSPENGVESYTLQLYGGARVSNPADGPESARVELMGMELDKALTLRVEGRMPTDEGEVLAGADLRDALALKEGSTLNADFGHGPVRMLVTGIVETGGPEDGSLIVSLMEAQRLLELDKKASAALLRADTSRLKETVAALVSELPGAEVKTLSQVARAEEDFLRKIEFLMFLVAVVVLVASAISVSSTMSATVLERLKEIGLMKAIGGTRTEIGAFFMAEGLGIGIAGGALGYMVGFLSAQAVSRGAFGSFIPVPLYLLPLGMLTGALIAAAASLWPLLGALRYRPSIILRGE